MALAELLPGIGSVLGGLGGLFGGGKKKSTHMETAQAISGQARGAREAAEMYGFNPLTLLGASSAVAGGGGGEASPLASVQILTEGLKDISDVTSGDAARRRQADQLNLDLRQLQLDQARSGVMVTTPRYASDGIGASPSPLGKRAVTVDQSHGGARGQARVNSPVSSEGVAGGSGDGGVPIPDSRLDVGTGIYLGGVHYKPSPGWSPASVVEEEYGDNEIVSTGYSALKLGADFGYNVERAFKSLTKSKPTMRQREYWPPQVRYSNGDYPVEKRATMRFDPNNRDGYYWAF